MAKNKATSNSKKTSSSKPEKKTFSTAASSSYSGVRKQVSDSIQSKGLWKALGAEFLGTFLLAVVVIASQGQPLYILFGLVGIVLTLGVVSGAHVNPAITIGAWVTKRVGWIRAVGYILAQALGAIAAFYTLSAFLGGSPELSAEEISYGYTDPTLFTATAVSEFEGKEWYVLASELIGTLILGYAVAYALRAKDSLTSAWAVGIGLFTGLMFSFTVAGYAGGSAILNPAVAISLQAYDASIWSYAIYTLGPIIGGTVGFGIYDLLRDKKA